MAPGLNGISSGSKPLINVPAKNGFNLDMSTMTPVEGKEGQFKVKDTNGKDYIVNASGVVLNGTLEGSNYVQTSSNKKADIKVSIYDGTDKNKDGIPDDPTEIFGGKFTYNGSSERLTPDSDDSASVKTTKGLTNFILRSGNHIDGYNTLTAPVKANPKNEDETHSTTDTTTVKQSPAERNNMEQTILQGNPLDVSSQIFKLPNRSVD